MKVLQTTWNNAVFGIVNADGKPWTYRVFRNHAEAAAYLEKRTKDWPMLKLSRHRVAPVSVTVRAIRAKP